MDRIILGDNQFFGINHMSEDKALELAVRFSTDASILRVIDDAYACGVRGYMFNTHARVVNLCQSFRDRKRMYSGMNLYPSMPYAHKYANAVAEKGIFGALKEFLFDVH